MATPKSQQIGIWIIATFMIIGALGSSLMIVLSNQNQAADSANLQTISKEYSAKVATQTTELSNKYYSEFSKYATTPVVFTADDVKSLSKIDLKVGEGTEIKADTAYSAYYIGWNPKGVIFDQSISGGTLKVPIAGGNLITGWNEGVIGMKFGGIREISIPSDKAYGATGAGENIPANTPIKFIVMVIPKVTDVPVPMELLQYSQSQSASQ